MSGHVALVGAGPGDPGLMTARALDLVARADVILHDRLIPDGALEGTRDDAELVYVGKRPGKPSMEQEQINELLVERGRAGARVVRLKGGDPFVFGRGGEEAIALAEAGISFEVVPGVTAGVAAAAYAGIPVTQREVASAVAFVTGHEDPDKAESALDWRALAAFPGTLAFYMGVGALPKIAERLMAAGRSGSEPAAVIERGTHPDQRVISATLDSLAAEAHHAEVRPPSITVVGDVVGLRDRLAWWERRPLAGRTVAVTRARAQASGLARRLRELGAAVIEAPLLRVRPLDTEVPALDPYDLVCLTSANGVRMLFERLAATGRDARALAGRRVAAVGPGTAAALREHGVLADLVPERSVAEGLLDALGELPVKRALVIGPEEARDVLPEGLRQRGAEVDSVALYVTEPEDLQPEALAAARSADYVTFTSSSTVRFFLRAAGGQPGLSPSSRIASIGPVTSGTLREHGMEPALEAERHDVDGLIDALVADAAR